MFVKKRQNMYQKSWGIFENQTVWHIFQSTQNVRQDVYLRLKNIPEKWKVADTF